MKKYSTCFDIYSVTSKQVRDFFQIFVTFSENLDFKRATYFGKYLICSLFQAWLWFCQRCFGKNNLWSHCFWYLTFFKAWVRFWAIFELYDCIMWYRKDNTKAHKRHLVYHVHCTPIWFCALTWFWLWSCGIGLM